MPARYVSGYFRAATTRVEQNAGHAWAEAFVPELGWVGFDPANGVCATDAHVRVAVGLDYLGAAPLRGTRYGGAGEALSVKVRVDQAHASSRRIEQALPVDRLGLAIRRRCVGTLRGPMTYCCGILVRDGLVMFADTRTNAGVDNISTFRKLHVFSPAGRAHHGDRLGRQPVDQPIGGEHPARGLENPDDRRDRNADQCSDDVSGRAADRTRDPPAARHGRRGTGGLRREIRRLLPVRRTDQGRAAAAVHALLRPAISSNARTDTPYLQIGEHKYGKPVLDRAITYDIDLYDALKVGLVSVDSTMRSNLSVGLPLDILIARRDACDGRAQLPDRAGRALFLTICASAGRRRCGPLMPASRAPLQEHPLSASDAPYSNVRVLLPSRINRPSHAKCGVQSRNGSRA